MQSYNILYRSSVLGFRLCYKIREREWQLSKHLWSNTRREDLLSPSLAISDKKWLDSASNPSSWWSLSQLSLSVVTGFTKGREERKSTFSHWLTDKALPNCLLRSVTFLIISDNWVKLNGHCDNSFLIVADKRVQERSREDWRMKTKEGLKRDQFRAKRQE